MKNEAKIKGAVQGLLRMFETGELPAAIARTTIQVRKGFNKPSDTWSLGNRLLMYLAETDDARGYKQWQAIDRHVSKGAKAFHILAPRTKKIKEKNDKGEEEEKVIFVGFIPIPVFAVEDTEGEPLPYCNMAPEELPPLYYVAEKFGVKVKFLPRGILPELGHFSPRKNEIVARTHDPDVFFHELAHAVHATFRELKGGQHEDQEIVAQTVSSVLCQMYGYDGYLWHGWEYIKLYAQEKDSKVVIKKIMGLLSDVEEVLRRIFDAEGEVAAEAS